MKVWLIRFIVSVVHTLHRPHLIRAGRCITTKTRANKRKADAFAALRKNYHFWNGVATGAIIMTSAASVSSTTSQLSRRSQKREKWSSRITFLFASLGCALGFGKYVRQTSDIIIHQDVIISGRCCCDHVSHQLAIRLRISCPLFF